MKTAKLFPTLTVFTLCCILLSGCMTTQASFYRISVQAYRTSREFAEEINQNSDLGAYALLQPWSDTHNPAVLDNADIAGERTTALYSGDNPYIYYVWGTDEQNSITYYASTHYDSLRITSIEWDNTEYRFFGIRVGDNIETARQTMADFGFGFELYENSNEYHSTGFFSKTGANRDGGTIAMDFGTGTGIISSIRLSLYYH